MNLAELQAALLDAGVPADAVSLQGKSANEAFVLEQQSPTLWLVYYSERGLQTGPSWFGTEDEACRYVLRRLA
jgi:hypothetical protein